MEMKKEQASKVQQNSRQVYLGKNIKVCQNKVLNPINQQYLGQRMNPVAGNFHHPGGNGENDKLQTAM